MPKKLLLCDDDPDLVKVLSLRLKQAGFDVAIALDAQQAVQMAKRLKPDCIITDVDMPAGGAYQALRILDQNNQTVSIPVITMSGSDLEGTRLREYKKGYFFKKPVDTSELIKAIHDVTGGGGEPSQDTKSQGA